ncbi:hypothetical protein JR316_0013453 [Psilocybe cubensis]|uniref:Uncharacterized protein n=2 Tax=Psilocybe cubensis TaxID=181762 RepID=A0ACB8GGW1_PSICU|nr:uncharacterized protein JR316_0013453 [Psilocybe cubensis]KAH9474290.1 hypothetical protein JR316_0013453 [Psilocybe cubensis]
MIVGSTTTTLGSATANSDTSASSRCVLIYYTDTDNTINLTYLRFPSISIHPRIQHSNRYRLQRTYLTPPSRTPPPNHNRSSPNIPAIVGGTIGGLLLLALCGVLYVFMSRRRRRMATEARRRTFHRDMMVQRRAGGGGGAGTGLVSQGPGVGGGGAAPTANGNVNVNEEGSRVGDEPRHDIPAPAPPALLPPADPPVPTTRASDLPCVLPALSFWSWTGTGSSSISIAGGNDSSDVESQSQSISRGLSSANDMERGFAGAGFPGNLGIASGLGLAPGGGTTTDRGIPSINGRAPPLGTGHIVPSPKGPRGPAKHGGAADGDVYTPAQPTPFVSQLPFQSVSSPQLPNSAAAVATPPTSATVALARAQTTTGASGTSATPKRGRGNSITRAVTSRPARLPTALSSLTIPPPSPISSIPPSPSIPITPTVPPNAPPRTQRQAEIAARIDMLSAQMVEVVRAQRDARAGRFDAAREGNRWSMREDGSVVLSPVSPQSGFGPVVSPTGTGVRASVGGATMNTTTTTMTNSETATTTSGSVSTVTMARYDAVLAEMQREMVWLRDTEHSAWAMGLTEVRPPGWARYMTP